MAVRALPLVVALALATAAPAAAESAPPSFVLILLDDVGYGDLGAYGGSYVATPVLDSLASEGMRFTNYHANAPLCNPSRAAILTGLFPIRLGMRAPLDSERGLPPGIETLAERLRGAGYATGHFGKWHLGSRPEHLPTRRGFDRAMLPVVANGPYLDREISIDGGDPVVAEEHLTELTTDHALAFLAENAGRPFFLNLWYNAAHRPYQPPPRWAARYPDDDAGRYAATLSHADEQIGRLLEALRDLGLEDRTLVLVTSDNGSTHPALEGNAGLRGGKGEVFEGGIRLPLIARWPSRIEAGGSNDSLVLGIDLFPTLAELAGVPAGSELPGRSLVPALAGEPLAREAAIAWEAADRPLPVDLAEASLAYAVRRGDWKLVRSREAAAGASVLFDLATDPGETLDVAPDHPQLVAELETAYRLWRARESSIDVPVLRTSGASALGSWLLFHGGFVDLVPDARLRLGDGDFSFHVRATPTDVSDGPVIASHPGSWTLGIRGDGSVELAIPREDGSRQVLASPPRVHPGVATDLAFSIFAVPGGIDVRLFVDGRLEASVRLAGAMRGSDAALRLGNGSHGGRPFLGTLWAPRFRSASLDAEDLADLDFDGVANAEDDCLDAPNGPARPDAGGGVQRDEDGDGIGTACDSDFDADGTVGVSDLLALYARFGQRPDPTSAEARFDLDGSSAVSLRDLAILYSRFGGPPGPSGLGCTAAAPCADPLRGLPAPPPADSSAE